MAKGLLTAADVVNSTSGLLHNPDVFLQQLYGSSLLQPGASMRAPTKADFDPHGISNIKLDRPWNEIPFTRQPSGLLIPKNVMDPHTFYMKNKGGAILSVSGDKAHADQVTSIGGNTVYPVQGWGGGPFMRLGRTGVWAADQGSSTRIANRVFGAQRKYDTDNILITHATMGPHSIDFQHAPSDAMVSMLPYTKISSAGREAINERMAKGVKETVMGKSKVYAYPDFPGIYSPKLPSWLAESNNRRKHFVKLMDNRQMVEAGVPSPGVARLATTDPDQLGVPWLSSGMDIARVKPGVHFDEQSRHPAFPVETPGTYVGSLGAYVPMQTMFHDWYQAHGHGKNFMKKMELGGADQAITQQWLDRLVGAR